MKKFLLITTIIFTATIPALSYAAGTPITDDIAKKYFDNCVSGAQKEGTMTPATQQRYCACTALNMKQNMSQEDLAALSAQGDVARAALNKVLLNVNGPCMEYSTHDLINKKCMTDVKDPAICSCLSTKMGNYIKQVSGQMMPKLLAANPNAYDLVTPIMESPEVENTQKQIAMQCATNPNN